LCAASASYNLKGREFENEEHVPARGDWEFLNLNLNLRAKNNTQRLCSQTALEFERWFRVD